MDTHLTLYHTPDWSRFFLLPQPDRLPAGDLTLHPLEGPPIAVAEDAVTHDEVTAEVARAHLQQTAQRALRVSRSALYQLLTFNEQIPPPTDQTTQAQQQLNALHTLEAALPLPTLRLPSGEPIDFFTELEQLAQDALSDDPDQLEAAQARASELQAILESQDLPASLDLSRLPAMLQASRADLERDDMLRETNALLREFANEVDRALAAEAAGEPVPNASAPIFQLFDRFAERINARYEARQAALRDAKYEAQAQAALDQAMEGFEGPTLSDDDIRAALLGGDDDDDE